MSTAASPSTGDPSPSGAHGPSAHEPSAGELVSRLTNQVSALVRSEIALATTELKRKGVAAGVGIGVAAVGAVLALYGGGALVATLVLALATALDAWLAALIVGVVLLALAGALVAVGVSRVKKAVPPVPEKALDSAKRDVETVKESLHR